MGRCDERKDAPIAPLSQRCECEVLVWEECGGDARGLLCADSTQVVEQMIQVYVGVGIEWRGRELLEYWQ